MGVSSLEASSRRKRDLQCAPNMRRQGERRTMREGEEKREKAWSDEWHEGSLREGKSERERGKSEKSARAPNKHLNRCSKGIEQKEGERNKERGHKAHCEGTVRSMTTTIGAKEGERH